MSVFSISLHNYYKYTKFLYYLSYSVEAYISFLSGKRCKKEAFINSVRILIFYYHLNSQTLTLVSTLPLASIKYLLLAAIVETNWLCASNSFLLHLPVLRSHILIDLSSLHEYKYFPEWCKAIPLTQLSCPEKVCKHYPFNAFQSLINLSLDAENMN